MNSYTSNSPQHPDSWNDEMKKMNFGSLAEIKVVFDTWNAISNMERLWTNFDPKGLNNIVIQPSSNNHCRVHIFKELHAKLSRDYCFNTTNIWCHIVRCTFAYLVSNSLIQPDDLFVGAEAEWNAIKIRHLTWTPALWGERMFICHFAHGQTDLYEVAAFLHDFTRINVKDPIVPPLETVDPELFRALGSLTPAQQNALGKQF
ncbi:hypothetical protein C2G38_2280817 [Gigaspora rosea]|uniref:Uncharacterized protein n=1 Tax=Gigaspora rosea TaxID=44941 RepID=A0A397W0K1_9GLOM|nr:hypothetical protein C2G38_2280817 [Gigaspora rosea]